MRVAGRTAARQAGRARAGLLLPWAAMLLSGLALAGLGRLAVPAGGSATGGPAPALASSVAALGALCVVAVLALDRALLAPERVAQRVLVPDRSLAERYLTAAHLTLWSLAELPAILGFAHLLLGGTLRVHLALCGLSLGLLALLMPTAKRIGARLERTLH
jgi:hypothetical protein